MLPSCWEKRFSQSIDAAIQLGQPLALSQPSQLTRSPSNPHTSQQLSCHSPYSPFQTPSWQHNRFLRTATKKVVEETWNMKLETKHETCFSMISESQRWAQTSSKLHSFVLSLTCRAAALAAGVARGHVVLPIGGLEYVKTGCLPDMTSIYLIFEYTDILIYTVDWYTATWPWFMCKYLEFWYLWYWFTDAEETHNSFPLWSELLGRSRRSRSRARTSLSQQPNQGVVFPAVTASMEKEPKRSTQGFVEVWK